MYRCLIIRLGLFVLLVSHYSSVALDSLVMNVLNVHVNKLAYVEEISFLSACGKRRWLKPSLWAINISERQELNTSSTLLSVGRYHWLQGQCDLAKRSWISANEVSYQPISLFLMGWMAENMNNRQQALRYWELAEAGLYFARIGESLKVAGDFEGAKKQLEMASQIDLESPIIWRLLAETYEQLKEDENSANAWRQVYSFLPQHNPEYWWAKARQAHLSGNIDEALQVYEQGAELIGGRWEIRFLEEAGVMLEHVDRFEEAKNIYLRLIILDPNRIYAPLYLARVEMGLGHTDLAVQWYVRVLEMEPMNETACFYLKSIKDKTTEIQKAIDECA